jgi:chorismate--pyruvate lyase
VISRLTRTARWQAHANAVNPPPALRSWLIDKASLTVKLSGRAGPFRVQRLRQGRAMSLADEYAMIRQARRMQVREREVLLRCGERPMVYAHTIVPLKANASDWPFFNTLGERSLGTTLFGDPAVKRGELQFARLHARHPLARRACGALGVNDIAWPLYARRCLFQRKHGVLLVTEVFLPAIVDIGRGDAILPSDSSAMRETSGGSPIWGRATQ